MILTRSIYLKGHYYEQSKKFLWYISATKPPHTEYHVICKTEWHDCKVGILGAYGENITNLGDLLTPGNCSAKPSLIAPDGGAQKCND